ncbi:nitrite reductase small subunit NirD [Niallia taxi]|uniref:Nitrite reductase small subunit NirD n=1 Tax=Niallia taxi TaxID=2499688 RepID=A0A3S2TRB4_9BACI|nr:nitrite reductase small subunit NirD [Niallia taxi]MCM3217880.1 nitrite reductase small subunit NirD [Niallia taxi]MDK8641472.1 nitrite reductase small subunit NirD [Niallia taxi]MED4039393.1 nitrite reductase small subunit NirD [Niallia taxi]MED4055796.1 nitrite reductase small subunit NirD [Niallia taxi]MED4121458.1 nitrite reductase small subunit NirD [Niallia taxi]
MTATKEWTKIMKKSELPQQIGKEVHIKGKSIALFHLSNGEVRAIENRSPHRNGPLAEGIVSGEYVFCPLYDWKISLVTGLVQKPDNGCVEVYEIEVKDDDIYVMV